MHKYLISITSKQGGKLVQVSGDTVMITVVYCTWWMLKDNPDFFYFSNMNKLYTFQLIFKRRLMTQIPIKTGLPLVLVDFDQTLTVNDTIAVLGQFGLDHHPELNFNWSFFADSFMKEYYAHKATLPPCNDWTCFLDQLNSFKPIEAASLARVNKHQVFKDLTQQQLFQGGQDRSQKELQPGCIDALRPYIPQIRVVSLNWSKDWVLGFLNQLQLNKNQIFSNDIVFNEDGVSPKGEIIPRILTCGDKTQVIQDCIVQKEQKKFIYIGDSIGDVEALGN